MQTERRSTWKSDEHAGAAIAGMPLGQQVLIDGVKFLGIGGTGGGRFPPDGFQPGVKQGVDHLRNRGSQMLLVQIAPPCVA